MSSASSSTETPALIRRTLDWLSTSLLKGMSREALRVIFLAAVAMVGYSATGAESLSLGFQPVTETGRSPLTLSSGRRRTGEPDNRIGGNTTGRKSGSPASRSRPVLRHRTSLRIHCPTDRAGRDRRRWRGPPGRAGRSGGGDRPRRARRAVRCGSCDPRR